jgi:hypothetical protein
METKDPALTKTPISSYETIAEIEVNTTPNAHINDANVRHDEEEQKGTQTLQETVIGSNLIDDIENLDDGSVDESMANRSTNERIAGESVTHQDPLRAVVVDTELAERDVLAQNTVPAHNTVPVKNHDELEANTSVSNGTDTFKEDVVDSEHVNDGDNPARQPDRRDQSGNAFDEGINEETVGSEAPKSEDITDMNRYASIDNAQSRILNPDEKD